jgi:hypothetical protein
VDGTVSGGDFLIALLLGILRFLLADGVVWLKQLGDWPLIPSVAAGWLCSEGVHRSVSGRTESPSAMSS